MTRQNRSNWRWLAAAVPLLTLLGGCGSDDSWPKDHAGPKVVVSFAPLYCFAANVAGPDAVVKPVMTSSGPHHFNPTDADARLLRKADVMFINGLGLDAEMARTLKRGSGNRKLTVVELGDKIPQAQLLEGSHHDHAGHHHHDSIWDPHVWLSPDQAVVMVEVIRDKLKELDPGHAAGYDQRAAEYIGKLQKLKADGVELLKGKTDRKLVTFHESLPYFARTFNLDVAGVVQKNPGVEPTADEVARLIAVCKEKKVRVLAVEPQYTANTSARTILDRLKQEGVPDPVLVEIDPLETVPGDQLTPDWYEQKMRANLEALAKAMK